MGLFVSSDVLSNSLKHILTVEAPMAMLPVKSPLQEHMAFQVSPPPSTLAAPTVPQTPVLLQQYQQEQG